MQRSSSATRVSNQHSDSSRMVARGGSRGALMDQQQQHLLPTYDPQSAIGKKAAARTKFSRNAIHGIPLLLILCALLLWFFSTPESARRR